MDYKKEYKKRLDDAKYWHDVSEGDIPAVLEEIFPELCESDGYNWIPKEIIKYLKEKGDFRSCWIAWLEKQSTPQVRTGLEWLNTIDDACDKRYAEEYAHGEYCHEQSFKWGFQEGVDWLEKQGEQKPVISNDALREGIAHFGITQYQIDNWLKKYVDVEKQGEQKPFGQRKECLDCQFNH